MDRGNLAEFLRSRRERLQPRDVGLPGGARRRTPGLRREEVAVAAHISIEYYTRLEQARAPKPSSQVLEGIATALRLTDAESDHLHLLADAVATRNAQHCRTVRPSILTLLERLPDTAGFVLSATLEVLACNDLAAALMEDFNALAPDERNLARQAFLPATRVDTALSRVSDDADFRHAAVAQLRAAHARYPTDPAVIGLVDELHHASPDFARLWARHDVQPAPMLTKTFHHPLAGEITVDCDAMTLDDTDQHLVLYSAPPHSRHAEALAFLHALGSENLDPMRGM